MITISIDNQNLDLPRDITIPMEESFAFDEFLSVPGEHSWKFSIPKTPTNRQVFGFADVPDVVWDPATNYPCRINVDGRLFKRGKLFIEQDERDYFDVYFVGEIGVLAAILGNKKLNELDWGEVTGIANMFDYAEMVAASTTAYNVTFYPVVMPSAAGGFTGDQLNRLEIQVNPLATDNYLGFDAAALNPLAPQVYVRKLWQILLADYGITVSSDFLEDAEINTLTFFNTVVANEQDSSGAYTNNFGSTLVLADYVPDMEVKTFLVEFAKLFNLFVFFDEELMQLSIVDRNTIFNWPVVSWQDKLVNYQVLFEDFKPINLGYDYDFNDLEGAKKYKGTGDGFSGTLAGIDAVEAGQAIDIRSKISTLPMSQRNGHESFYMPYSSASINSKVGVKLLFYRGVIQPFDAANTPELDSRPFASSNSRFLTQSKSLLWQGNGNENLYGNHWEKYIAKVYQNRSLKLTLKLTESDLINFNPYSIYQINHWKCLVKKLEYDLGEDETLVEAEVIKL